MVQRPLPTNPGHALRPLQPSPVLRNHRAPRSRDEREHLHAAPVDPADRIEIVAPAAAPIGYARRHRDEQRGAAA